MANVLHVHKEVEIVNDYLRGGAAPPLGMVTISYDEKPGIQALAVTTPDRPPVPFLKKLEDAYPAAPKDPLDFG